MKLDKLDAVEVDREDESVTSRTARLKKRISNKINKVVSRRQQKEEETNEEEENAKNVGDKTKEAEAEEIPSSSSSPQSPLSSQSAGKNGCGGGGGGKGPSGEAGDKKGASSSSKAAPGGGGRSSSSRRGSFSYLDLLEKGEDGAFPHRTQPIQGPLQNRRRSASREKGVANGRSMSSSTEYINQTKKSDLMARSNPIGLAEPKVRRDGYAVGRDGSFYRSSEHIFAERRSSSAGQSSSSSSSQQSERRASTSCLSSFSSSSSSSGMGIRHGSGIIATGKKSSNPWGYMGISTPFGGGGSSSGSKGSKAAKHSAWKISVSKTKKETISSTSTTTSSTTIISKSSKTETSSSKTTTSSSSSTAVSSFIQNGIKEMESLTKAASTESNAVSTISRKEETETTVEETRSSSSFALESSFRAVDVAVRSSLAQEEEETFNFTVKRGRNGSSRTRSHSLTSSALPEQQVTISLPASRRVSRQASVDRDMCAPAPHPKMATRRRRDSSVEVFNGTYEMKLPSKKSASRKGSVTKLSSSHIVYNVSGEETEQLQGGRRQDSSESPRPEGGEKVLQTARKDEKEEEEGKSIPRPSSPPREGRKGMEKVGQEGQKEEEKEVEELEGRSGSFGKVSQAKGESSEAERRCSVSSSSGGDGVRGGEERKVADDVRKEGNNNNQTGGGNVGGSGGGVGDALRGLSAALESLQEQQRQQKSKLINGASAGNKKNKGGRSQTTSATVSLRGSRRSSRAASPDRASSSASGGAIRSRRNSMDLYTADVEIKLSKKRGGSVESLVERSTLHIRCDEDTRGDLRLCARCHAPDHDAGACTEFGALGCPRCLEWDHWEDTCPHREDEEGAVPCKICQTKGHSNKVHTATDYKQRRMTVDTLGWEPFREWFFETEFRSWWQLNGCVGVPLYKIYKRNTAWRREVAPLTEDELNNNEVYNQKPMRGTTVNIGNDDNAASSSYISSSSSTTAASSIKTNGSIVDNVLSNIGGSSTTTPTTNGIPIPPPPPPPSSSKRNYAVERDDSIDELVKAIKAPRKRVELNLDNDSGGESGRSTPEHLKKYSGSANCRNEDDEDGGDEDENGNQDSVNNHGMNGEAENGVEEADPITTTKKKRGRTFSETLKMLDQDILAELDVN